MVDVVENHRFVIVPGIYIGDRGHTFIQILNGNPAESRYHRFDIHEFQASNGSFEIRISSNTFSRSNIQVDIDDYLVRIHSLVGECPMRVYHWILEPESIASVRDLSWLKDRKIDDTG